MKKILSVMLTVLIAVSIATSVSAFGISAPYWNDNPLVLYPGESKDFAFTLQNMGSTEAVTMTVTLIGDESITSIIDVSNEYLVPIDASNVKVTLKAEVPVDAELGTEYAYTATFRSIRTSEGAEGIALGTSFEKTFKVVVGEKPAEEETKKTLPISNAVMAIIIVAVLVLLWWFLQKNKKRR